MAGKQPDCGIDGPTEPEGPATAELLAGTKVAVVCLGCPKNDVDAEYIMGLLKQAGAECTDDPSAADVVIVNTCAFIQPAVEQAIEALLEAAEGKRLVVCAGCLPQRYGPQLMAELPEIAGFCGPEAVPDIAQVVRRVLDGERVWHAPKPRSFVGSCELPRVRLGMPWTHVLKIADGCSHRCTFCTIPSIRGPFRSRPVADVIAEAEQAVGAGAVEICIVAQDTASYGTDLGLENGLARLLRELGQTLPREVWIRVQYIHPDRLTMDVVEAMLEVPQVVPYFDLPFQHAAESVLRQMGRRGTAESYHLMVAAIRDMNPDAAVRATFIVGFPGESSDDFHTLLDFVDLIEPDHTAVFPYWPEEGTPAARLTPKVKLPEVRRRHEELQETAQKLAQIRSERFVGRRLQVLVEQYSGQDQYVGRTFRDAPDIDGVFYLLSGAAPSPGQRVWAEVRSAEGNDLYGVAG